LWARRRQQGLLLRGRLPKLLQHSPPTPLSLQHQQQRLQQQVQQQVWEQVQQERKLCMDLCVARRLKALSVEVVREGRRRVQELWARRRQQGLLLRGRLPKLLQHRLLTPLSLQHQQQRLQQQVQQQEQQQVEQERKLCMDLCVARRLKALSVEVVREGRRRVQELWARRRQQSLLLRGRLPKLLQHSL